MMRDNKNRIGESEVSPTSLGFDLALPYLQIMLPYLDSTVSAW